MNIDEEKGNLVVNNDVFGQNQMLGEKGLPKLSFMKDQKAPKKITPHTTTTNTE